MGAIADAVETHFHRLNRQLNDVLTTMQKLQLVEPLAIPPEFPSLKTAIEKCLEKVRQSKPTVQQVKKNLDVLRDGVRTLNLYSSELNDDMVRKVNDAASILQYQVVQLDEIGFDDSDVTNAIDQIRSHLNAERPWLDINDLDDDIKLVRETYELQRRELLGLQEQQTEASRGRVKKRSGYSTLTSEQSEAVLREFDSAETNTSTEAISPPLLALRDSFSARLDRCEVASNQKLDEILSEKDKKIVRPMTLNIYRNRIINDSVDVDKLVEEIRRELMEQLKADVTIRIS